jgi:hypothetical protein
MSITRRTFLSSSILALFTGSLPLRALADFQLDDLRKQTIPNSIGARQLIMH